MTLADRGCPPERFAEKRSPRDAGSVLAIGKKNFPIFHFGENKTAF